MLRLLHFLSRSQCDNSVYPILYLTLSKKCNFTKLAGIYHWGKVKISLAFGDLDVIFKV